MMNHTRLQTRCKGQNKWIRSINEAWTELTAALSPFLCLLDDFLKVYLLLSLHAAHTCTHTHSHFEPNCSFVPPPLLDIHPELSLETRYLFLSLDRICNLTRWSWKCQFPPRLGHNDVSSPLICASWSERRYWCLFARRGDPACL